MDNRIFYIIEFPLMLFVGIVIGLALAEDFEKKPATVVLFGKRKEPGFASTSQEGEESMDE